MLTTDICVFSLRLFFYRLKLTAYHPLLPDTVLQISNGYFGLKSKRKKSEFRIGNSDFQNHH
ncbi:MAG: hypothetical protein B6D62_03120 [Candidatus Cloacimonas sp. 4484_275]|nr:MAG: hypothetical protein B6D62_03120 [Candidatus Cloacimonas sp. 4484_275]RLC51909.1 MAG: hypothetical protein DRZ79_02030 [Candidatus Cloacimonadota bacterium]